MASRVKCASSPGCRAWKLDAAGASGALHIHVHVVGDVVDNLDDSAAGERELALVVGAHRVTAVVADAQAFTAQRVMNPEIHDRQHVVLLRSLDTFRNWLIRSVA